MPKRLANVGARQSMFGCERIGSVTLYEVDSTQKATEISQFTDGTLHAVVNLGRT